MPTMRAKHTIKSQMGFQTGAGSTYQEGGGDISIAQGQLIFQRIQTWIPPGSTINSATLTHNVLVKNGGTTQSSLHNVRAHASGDSPILRVGQNEWTSGPRPETSAVTAWTCSWVANGGEQKQAIDVRAILQELVNRPDFQPGAYVTFIIWCHNENGSDMSIRANNDFDDSPLLDVNWTDPVTDVKYTINRCENSEFDPVILTARSAGSTDPAPYWWQGDYFGGHVSSPNMGTIAIDTSFTRLPGVPTLRFTCGTPPAPADAGKFTGPNYGLRWKGDDPFIFCGWVYVSTAIPTTSMIAARDPYFGHTTHEITARGQWVPFCTHPLFENRTDWVNRWPALAVRNFQQGWQFWISEPAFISSPFRQMPFNGLTPDVKDPGLVTLVDHRSTAGRMQSSRVWTPRTAVKRNGAPIRVPRYTKRADGILQLSEPLKGGVTIPNLPAVRIDSYPAGKTFSEL